MSSFEKISSIGVLIGSIIAYWRYELSKYNQFAREALDKFVELFQGNVFSKKDIPKLSSVLMTLATFNNTQARIKTKRMMNCLLGSKPSELGRELLENQEIEE